MLPPKSIKRILRFGGVGGLAAATHFFVAVLLISQAFMNPLLANVIAFLVAFIVSYAGQRYWTFAANYHNHHTTLWRYGLTAIIGFLINETILWLGLTVFPAWYPLILGLAIIVAAISTYWLSANWAFKIA
ncbi:GtrA family protein [Thiolinea disciformis]|uniref:GtrA family protein n=1 Tax=Thiolinea disciformis TaxID=125614 RepID=UPI00036B39B8|nr:GtrA family protein [Thiolinea disciformis]